jgi:hypothetical protein
MFWGHAAQNHTNRKVHGRKIGMWAFDESEPVPDGVIIHRNKLPAVWTGELAERIKAELRRRTLSIKGRAKPRDTSKFTGLFVCGECANTLVCVSKAKSHQRGLRCMGAVRNLRNQRVCTQGTTPYRYVQAWLDHALRQWLEDRPPEVFDAPDTDIHDKARQMATVEKERNQLERKINRLMDEQSDAPESAQGFYRKKIAELSERDAMLQARLYELEREVKYAESSSADQHAALDDLKAIAMDKFWQLPDGDINRLLSRIFGNRQLVVFDKQIVGSVERKRRRYNYPYSS